MPDAHGGPAFPLSGPVVMRGMALRDYFAAQALAGWLASFASEQPHPASRGKQDMVAQEAYQMADAMLKARSVTNA
jgi:hypothetical protein